MQLDAPAIGPFKPRWRPENSGFAHRSLALATHMRTIRERDHAGDGANDSASKYRKLKQGWDQTTMRYGDKAIDLDKKSLSRSARHKRRKRGLVHISVGSIQLWHHHRMFASIISRSICSISRRSISRCRDIGCRI